MAYHSIKKASAVTSKQMALVQSEPAASQSPPVDEPLLLRTYEAAQLLQISERKLYYLLKDGAIPAVRFGRSVRVSKSAIAQYIHQQEHQTG